MEMLFSWIMLLFIKIYNFENIYLYGTKFNVAHNIPYHPELNPTECIFSLLRKKLLANIINSSDSII